MEKEISGSLIASCDEMKDVGKRLHSECVPEEGERAEEHVSKCRKPDRNVSASDALECGRCGSLSGIDKILFENYGVSVCTGCKIEFSDDYKSLTQTDALKRYLLEPHHIRDLKYILKENPRNRYFNSMKLFLNCQVRDVATKIWKSIDILEHEKKKRQEIKFTQDLRKVSEQLTANASASLNVPPGTSSNTINSCSGNRKKVQAVRRKKFLMDAVASIRAGT